MEVHQIRLVFLVRQHRTETKAIETAKKQEKLAQDKFDKHCRNQPRSKYIGNFQDYTKDHKVWPYPAFSEHSRYWTKEKDRKTCALDMQGRKVGFGSWYNCQYDDYTCEEYYATKDNKDRVRTVVDLTPEDRVNHELKDDDSFKRL